MLYEKEKTLLILLLLELDKQSTLVITVNRNQLHWQGQYKVSFITTLQAFRYVILMLNKVIEIHYVT